MDMYKMCIEYTIYTCSIQQCLSRVGRERKRQRERERDNIVYTVCEYVCVLAERQKETEKDECE